MKEIKKIISLIILLFVIYPVFAQKKSVKKDRIILVGKITVIGDFSRENLAKIYGLTPEQAEAEDVYTIPLVESQLSTFRQVVESEVEKIKNGSFFITVVKPDYRLSEDEAKKYAKMLKVDPKTLLQDYDSIHFHTISSSKCISTFLIFGQSNLRVEIPFPFYIIVPEGEKALYFGSIVVHVNKDFEITSMEIKDEFDAASEILDKEFDGKYKLCRVQLTEIEKD